MAETYSKADLRSLLRSINVDIYSESGSDFVCFCPFHNNTDSPSFAISYEKGLFVCYNPNCNARGTVTEMVKSLTNRNDFEALRYIYSHRLSSQELLEEELKEILDDKPDFVEFSQTTLDKLYNDLINTPKAIDYFKSRNISLESINHFKLGYSEKQGMVTVPLHSPEGIPVGIIGRSLEGKTFKNSPNLPRNKTMFNLQKAKREGGTIIVVESSFDAIRLWQAGYPNAVATLGGSLSEINLANLNKYSSRIIIMTDNDKAGRALGYTIASKLKNKDVLWAYYNSTDVYPNGAKDVGDMNDEQIKQCIKNAISHYEYAVL
jgi:DNA primase